MSFRFFRRVRIAPGLTLNFSKRGASMSFGPRGMKYTVGTHGQRVTAGIPGTGLYYTEKIGQKGSPRSGSRGGQGQAVAGVRGGNKLNLGFFQKIFTPAEEKQFIEGCKEVVRGTEDMGYRYFQQSLHITDAAFLAGVISLKRENYDNAKVQLESVLARSKELGRYFQKHGLDITITVPITEEISAQIGADLRGVLLTLVEVYQRRKEYSQTVDCLKRLRKLEPADALIKVSLAEIVYEVNCDSERNMKYIVELADGTTNDTPVEATLLLYKAKALRKLGLHDASRDILTSIARKRKGRSEELLLAIAYEKALVYEQLGQQKMYRSELEKIYAQKTDYEDVSIRLGI